MNAKHRRTLEAIFARPVPANIRWSEAESLLIALGAERFEGAAPVSASCSPGPRCFHRPHPQPETDKGAVAAVRRFLESAGVKP